MGGVYIPGAVQKKLEPMIRVTTKHIIIVAEIALQLSHASFSTESSDVQVVSHSSTGL